ncbi:MAG: ATP synthase F1 subunit gamma [Dehalococcoidia bacterium]|nr:ATP synthase F1 subunit gamma [Dehalococcoidia bacterium]MSQ34189.1 ATP synthase F1 subunit gamma [Dehalococcoidia bacterium]
MANTRDLRRRIRSVKNIAKVTGAMQLIAASKMRRAQQAAEEGKAYADKIQVVLSDLVASLDQENLPPEAALLTQREVSKTLMVLVTPDRGLCGALVSNILRVAATIVRDSKTPVATVSVGRKGETFIVRTGNELRAAFKLSDRPRFEETTPITRIVVEEFRNHKADRVVIVYSDFKNLLIQRPVVTQLLPVEPSKAENATHSSYIYEPSAAAVLERIVPRYIETVVYHAILEAAASEHSARMVAMQKATDAASDFVEDLTLDLNKARQEQITGELLDIVGGVAAVQTG